MDPSAAAAEPLAQTPPAPQPAVPLPPLSPDLPTAPDQRTEEATGQTREEVIVQGRSLRGDPLAPLNARTFEATQAVDDAVVGPAARVYKKGLPAPLRDGSTTVAPAYGSTGSLREAR